ncbi:MAG: DUF4194 domain-containing protein [Nevskia sp.]|jgi:hypothetical protein|nr:DUF4194 domain-containing protein [Nevskia sp.]MCK9383036.1 DUF4194 domain-containing protein [Nevskia sp.]
MSISWETLAGRQDCIYNVEDFESAGYALITAQVLYESEPHQRLHYQIVSAYRGHYRERLSDLGLNFDINEMGRFCYAVPKRPPKVLLPLRETMLILAMRSIYHVKASRGELNHGAAEVTIGDLIATHRDLTGRELPGGVGDMRALFQPMKRWGLAKLINTDGDDEQPFVVSILPAIDVLVNENWLTRIAAYKDITPELAIEDKEE